MPEEIPWYKEFGAPTHNPYAYRRWAEYEAQQASKKRIKGRREMSANPERYRYIKGVKYKLVGIENRVDTAELWAENMRGHGEKIEIISIPEGYALYREESLDWHSLDPKDKSAVLQEQKNQIEAGGPLCQALDDIADEFTSYIIEEGDASRNYGQYADKFKEMNLPTWQGALSYMSHDESEHREILKIIVDVIKEKCRCH